MNATPTDRAALRSAVEGGASPPYVLFWDHRPQSDGALGPSCLSQWWPAPFAADGERFATAEHYMMWRKARLFGDEASAAAVLVTTSPARAKELGRAVSGFASATWVAHREEVVGSASLAKFGADPELGDFLLRTGDSVLVEASPDDRIWGTGLGAEHPDATRPDRWPGLNLLGFALMRARAALAARTGPQD